ncbi:MAG: prolyl oligopeptidase family serine peptidase [Bryobacteraceae bacterium]
MTREVLALALLAAAPLGADSWPLERLFSRPFVWGTSPERLTWAKQNQTLMFLWNSSGKRCLDLYAYHPSSQKLVRLTDLEPLNDDLNRTEAERDPRRRAYVEPPSCLAAFDISNDGAKAAFSYRGDLFLVSSDGASPPFRLTRTRDAEASPRFSPDARRLAFQRQGQIFVQDLSTGQLTQATDIESEAGALRAFEWSPDGKRFAYTLSSGRSRRMPLPNYSGRLVRAPEFARTIAGDEPPERKHFVVAFDGGKPVALEAGQWGAKVWGSATKWSPDSRYLLESSAHPKFKKRQIRVWDAAAGKVRSVFEESDDAWVQSGFTGWSPDSRQVFFNSERDGWFHLYRVSVEGGEPFQITRGRWETQVERFTGDPQWAGDWLYFTSTEAGPSERQFYRIRPDGSGKEKLSDKSGINAGAVSHDGRRRAILFADLKNPLDLYVDGRRVTTSPLAEFAKYDWPDTRFVSFPSRYDSKPVAAKILLPPGYAPDRPSGRPRPAVLFIHGAGYATSVLRQWGSYQEYRFAFNTYLANRGYVVLDMDYRGSSGYGRDWRAGVYLQLGVPDLGDVLGGVDYLRGLGNIDMSRVGIWGVSYGGFLTNLALFQAPGVFRAGASWAAVNDWENYNAGYTGQRLTSPEENPEAYRRSSPIHFSSNLKDKLLIVHGMVDDNVLFQDAVQLTEKLIHEGKDFAQIYYPEENHAFVRDETLVDAFRRTAEWFERWLQ